jgi:hypothetical protein
MLLLNPFVLAYLLCLAAFFIAALWPSDRDSSRSESAARPPESDSGICRVALLPRNHPSLVRRSGARGWGRPNLLPARELEAACAAEYAARASQAIKRIQDRQAPSAQALPPGAPPLPAPG